MTERKHVWKRPKGRFSKRARLTGKLEYSQIVNFYNFGKSTRQIAKIDGTSAWLIGRILKRHGVNLRPAHRAKSHYRAEAEQFGCPPTVFLRLKILCKLRPICIKCGEDDPRVLQVNHVNGKTRKLCLSEMHEILAGTKTDVDVRCANCNIRYEYERHPKNWHSRIHAVLQT